jgi:acyl-CoA hydrolase
MATITQNSLQRFAESRGADLRVVASGNCAPPWELLALIDDALPAYRLFMLNAPHGIPDHPGVTLETPFVGPGMRHKPNLRYLPARLSQVPTLLRTTVPPDIVCVRTSVPHAGRVSLGVEVNVLPAAIESARRRGGLVLAETDPGMPYTYGDAELEVSSFDGVLDGSGSRGLGPGSGAGLSDPVAMAIGSRIAERIGDGATLQLGIGLVPDAVLAGLSSRRRLGIWSEMVSDGILGLDANGSLDESRLVTASFAIGTDKLLGWLDRNSRVRMVRTEIANDPSRIAANPAMTSINTALQVDLFGQANASRIKGRIHSGFGGQTDFVVGALHSRGGQALMALKSWHPKADVSTIIPLLDEPVTSFQHTAVVTEQGVAEIFGNDERSQAHHLIEHAAHPRVRDELREEARALGLL